ncbi:c-type cytochrome [Aquabacterium sp. J223]|uniref:c-type cytochrome n=1 Tax=Aquabacterium sp. J223 TaxID=2898431 RepID=UPI0021ADA2A6|nr:c-type cytochrome [Aquabacterium sp. J223]UUX96057.1 c-type cytochrome [Aquabacterium sp. J223]
MSDDARHTDSDAHDAHEGPIKTPKQLALAVFWAFVIPIVAILLLVTYVEVGDREGAGSEGQTAEAIARRIQPVGTVEVKDVTDVASLKTGEQVYTAQCVACHGSGAAGAPKLGDGGAWSARLKEGYEHLLAAALKGKGNMPPQGGGDFTDFEIGRAVVYMANQSGGKLAEPQPPAPGAAPQAAAPAAADTNAAGAAAAQQVAAALASTQKPAAAAAAPAAGAVPALYTQACQVCHAAGVAGAPKIGDKAAWAPRLGQGLDALTASVIKGKGAMPPKGGAANASDADLRAVVSYMVGSVK